MNHRICLLLALALITTPGWAQVAGTWLVTMDGPGGSRTNELTIARQDGGHFATMASPQGPMEIGEIQVDGEQFEFRFSRQYSGGEVNMHYQGEVDGDQLTGSVTSMRGRTPFRGVRK